MSFCYGRFIDYEKRMAPRPRSAMSRRLRAAASIVATIAARTACAAAPAPALKDWIRTERKLVFADGSQRLRRFRAGETAWMPAQSHSGHNVGRTPTDALLIELKGGCN